jgi:hypothetical protein
MSWNESLRQGHRWLSLAFTAGVIANLAVLGMEKPPLWVGFLAVIPLALLWLTGMYLFVQPYLARAAGGRPGG